MAADNRYLDSSGIFLGFPMGRSPAGDLATAAMRHCIPSATDLKFTPIVKGRERSYWTSVFDETNVRLCLAYMTALGFKVTANQHRTITPIAGDEYNSWVVYVAIEEAAIKNADLWKSKKLHLNEVTY